MKISRDTPIRVCPIWPDRPKTRSQLTHCCHIVGLILRVRLMVDVTRLKQSTLDTTRWSVAEKDVHFSECALVM